MLCANIAEAYRATPGRESPGGWHTWLAQAYLYRPMLSFVRVETTLFKHRIVN